MAVLPATPVGVLGVDHRFTIGNNANANSKLKFRYTSAAPDVTALTAMAAAIHTAWAANLKAWLANSWSLNEIICQDLANPAAPTGVWSTGDPGSRTGTPGDAAQCVVVRYPITRRYRGGHPRGYWPYLMASDLSGAGTWNGTVIGNFQTAFQAYVAAIQALTAGGMALGAQVSVSYYSGPNYPATAAGQRQRVSSIQRLTPVVDVVGSPIANTKPGSQRRRLKRA